MTEQTDRELLEMAKEAGLTEPDLGDWITDYGDSEASIKRFAALVEAKEREACATACDAIYHQFIGPAFGEVRHGVAACSAAIRGSGKP